MKHSDTIGEIAKAMNKFQASPTVIGVNAKGYGYDYATLDKVISRLFPLLTEQGLSVVQPLDIAGTEPAIVTMIMHTSGEWISTSYPLEKAGIGKANDAQQFGAAVTYARRYGLLSAFGVPVGKDDDANILTDKPKAKKPAGKKYTMDEKTPIEILIEQMGMCQSRETLDTLCGSAKKLIDDSGQRDRVTSEYHVRLGELGEE